MTEALSGKAQMAYLELATLGHNRWWRYLLGLLLIIIMWQGVGSLPLLMLVRGVMSDGDASTGFDDASMRFQGVDPLISYLAISFMFIALLLGLYLAVRFLHKRGFITLITTFDKMSWPRFFTGFGVYLGLMLTIALITALLAPDSFRLSFNPGQFMLFLPFALLLTPLQACTEEFLFRGYIMQGLGRLYSHPAFVSLGSAILFTLPHLMNPEVQLDPVLIPLIYFGLGLFLAVITLRDNRLELAMGVHSANNLFAFLLFNYENSALESPSVFMATAPDPQLSLITIIIVGLVFYWIVFRWLPKRAAASSKSPH